MSKKQRQQLGIDKANNFMLMTIFSILADMVNRKAPTVPANFRSSQDSHPTVSARADKSGELEG